MRAHLAVVSPPFEPSEPLTVQNKHRVGFRKQPHPCHSCGHSDCQRAQLFQAMERCFPPWVPSWVFALLEAGTVPQEGDPYSYRKPREAKATNSLDDLRLLRQAATTLSNTRIENYRQKAFEEWVERDRVWSQIIATFGATCGLQQDTTSYAPTYKLCRGSDDSIISMFRPQPSEKVHWYGFNPDDFRRKCFEDWKQLDAALEAEVAARANKQLQVERDTAAEIARLQRQLAELEKMVAAMDMEYAAHRAKMDKERKVFEAECAEERAKHDEFAKIRTRHAEMVATLMAETATVPMAVVVRPTNSSTVESTTPCQTFELDLDAPQFNTCVCGHTKSAHALT